MEIKSHRVLPFSSSVVLSHLVVFLGVLAGVVTVGAVGSVVAATATIVVVVVVVVTIEVHAQGQRELQEKAPHGFQGNGRGGSQQESTGETFDDRIQTQIESVTVPVDQGQYEKSLDEGGDKDEDVFVREQRIVP